MKEAIFTIKEYQRQIRNTNSQIIVLTLTYATVIIVAILMLAGGANAQMVVQPGVQGGLIIAVPLAGNSALIVQPGTPAPPAFIVGLSGGSAMIVQPPTIPYVADDTDAAGVDDGSTPPDGSDGGDDGGDED